jgi:salicylate hydroxylase
LEEGERIVNERSANKVGRIAVVGGGIGGLTFAIAMRHHGIDVDIYEQAEELREVGAAVALSANATRFFYDHWGMGEEFERVAFEISALIYRDGKSGREIGRHAGGKAYRDLFGGPYLGIHRAELQKILSAKVGMERIHLGKRLANIDDTGEHAVLHFADGSRAEADIVIGADGTRSTVRNLMLGYEDYLYAGYTAFRGIVPIDKMPSMPDPTAIQFWMGESGHCLHYPIGGDRSGDINFFLVERHPTTWPVGQSTMYAADGEQMRLFKDWHPAIVEMIGSNTLQTVNQRWGMVYRMMLSRWSKGRITLLGDAAHALVPHHGQGANQSIEDAVVLADCLADAGSRSIEQVFERYERLRCGRARKVVYASVTTGDMLHLPPGENRDRRDARLGSHDAMLHHLGWIHGFDCSNFAEPNERQGGTWL